VAAMREAAMPGNPGVKGSRPVDAYVGARIRLRRNMLGMSQTEMADRIGITFQQVQKYEKGVNRVGASRLMQICEVLHVTPAWLFEGAPGAKPKPSAAVREFDAAFAAFQADGTAPRLIAVWPRLPGRIKRLVVALLREIADGRRPAP
jgi:transcriptional regulator with XRE-family HTH domain